MSPICALCKSGDVKLLIFAKVSNRDMLISDSRDINISIAPPYIGITSSSGTCVANYRCTKTKSGYTLLRVTGGQSIKVGHLYKRLRDCQIAAIIDYCDISCTTIIKEVTKC